MLAQGFHQAKAQERLQRCVEQKHLDLGDQQLLLKNLNENVAQRDHVELA
jgi:hypothetical protein